MTLPADSDHIFISASSSSPSSSPLSASSSMFSDQRVAVEHRYSDLSALKRKALEIRIFIDPLNSKEPL